MLWGVISKINPYNRLKKTSTFNPPYLLYIATYIIAILKYQNHVREPLLLDHRKGKNNKP